MSHVKNYAFTVHQPTTTSSCSLVVASFDTTARTLGEAEADFRHFLRTCKPELLDGAVPYGYRVEVSHV